MSHLVAIQTKVNDVVAIHAACRRLGLTEPVQGTAQLFSGEATGLLLQLPGWQYPAVIDAAAGTINFDNYDGAWGEIARLENFLQAYAVEKSRLEARKKGFQVSEEALVDGSIKVRIVEGY